MSSRVLLSSLISKETIPPAAEFNFNPRRHRLQEQNKAPKKKVNRTTRAECRCGESRSTSAIEQDDGFPSDQSARTSPSGWIAAHSSEDAEQLAREEGEESREQRERRGRDFDFRMGAPFASNSLADQGLIAPGGGDVAGSARARRSEASIGRAGFRVSDPSRAEAAALATVALVCPRLLESSGMPSDLLVKFRTRIRDFLGLRHFAIDR